VIELHETGLGDAEHSGARVSDRFAELWRDDVDGQGAFLRDTRQAAGPAEGPDHAQVAGGRQPGDGGQPRCLRTGGVVGVGHHVQLPAADRLGHQMASQVPDQLPFLGVDRPAGNPEHDHRPARLWPEPAYPVGRPRLGVGARPDPQPGPGDLDHRVSSQLSRRPEQTGRRACGEPVAGSQPLPKRQDSRDLVVLAGKVLRERPPSGLGAVVLPDLTAWSVLAVEHVRFRERDRGLG